MLDIYEEKKLFIFWNYFKKHSFIGQINERKEALNYLTDVPTEFIFMDYLVDELWNKVILNIIIVTSHAYTLIGYKEYKGAKLILLRNHVNITFLDIILVQKNEKANGQALRKSGLLN